MGMLLSIMDRLSGKPSSFELPSDFDGVKLNFLEAKPESNVQDVYNASEKLITEAQEALENLKNYKECKELIATALRERTPSAELACWNQLKPSILKLRDFHDLSSKINTGLIKIFETIWPDSETAEDLPMVARDILTQHQALVKQFAKILDFALEFDEFKMLKPGIQNDFFFYKRIMNKMTKSSRERVSMTSPHIKPLSDEDREKLTQMWDGCKEMETEIPSKGKTDMSFAISMLFAQSTPMLTTVATSLKEFVKARPEFKNLEEAASKKNPNRDRKNSPSIDNSTKGVPETTLSCLKVIAKVCQAILESRVELGLDDKDEVFLMRVLTGVVILFDHVCETGVFTKHSDIDVLEVVKVLTNQPEPSAIVLEKRQAMIRAIQYTTIHYKDRTTPSKITAAIDALTPPGSPAIEVSLPN